MVTSSELKVVRTFESRALMAPPSLSRGPNGDGQQHFAAVASRISLQSHLHQQTHYCKSCLGYQICCQTRKDAKLSNDTKVQLH